MNVKFYLAFLIMISIGCSKKTEHSISETVVITPEIPLGITIIGISEDMPSYVVRKDITFQERLDGEISSDTIRGSETVFFKLNEKVQLIVGSPTDEYDPETFLVSVGDTLHVQYIENKIHVNRLELGRLVPITWDYSPIFFENEGFRQLDSLKMFFLEEKGLSNIF